MDATPPGVDNLFSDATRAMMANPLRAIESLVQASGGAGVVKTRLFGMRSYLVTGYEEAVAVMSSAQFSGGDAYRSLFGPLLGPRSLITERDGSSDWRRARDLMERAMTQEFPGLNEAAPTESEKIVRAAVFAAVESIPEHSDVDLYQMVKQASTTILFRLLLRKDFDPGRSSKDAKVVHASTSHFRAFASTPVALKIPGVGKTSYAQGLEASEWLRHTQYGEAWRNGLVEGSNTGVLLERILEDVESNSLEVVEEEITSLLLISGHGIIPKAIAALLTFAVAALVEEPALQKRLKDNFTADLADSILLESARLWPPVLATPRLCPAARGQVSVCQYNLETDRQIFVALSVPNRTTLFGEEPHAFRPERWLNDEGKVIDRASFPEILSFGCGPRRCIGRELVMAIGREFLRALSSKNEKSWRISTLVTTKEDNPDGTHPNDIACKYLPVAAHHPKRHFRFT